jgi:type VI secretion system protein ImpG
MFNKYYQDELTYLRELGREFAAAYPGIAPMLAERGGDPDVERLLEGVAFLTGRIRQKLDDELPEVVHSVAGLLFPHYVRQIPATTVVEFTPLPNVVRERVQVARNAELASVPVDGVPCRFRTTQVVDLLPISVEDVRVDSSSLTQTLRIELRVTAGAALKNLSLERLRFYIHGERRLQDDLRLWLGAHCAGFAVAAVDSGGRDTTIASPPAKHVQLVGFDEADALIPYPHTVYPGYRLLQEYFTLPQKFAFFEVGGFAEMPVEKLGERFAILVQFKDPLPNNVRVTKETLKLYCSPAVNLFSHVTDPLKPDLTKYEYLVRPSGGTPNGYEIYSIDDVVGIARRTSQRVPIPAFLSFLHELEPEGSTNAPIFYEQHLRPAAVGDGVDLYMSFGSPQDVGVLPDFDVVSIDATCTNRRLPTQLKLGDVKIATATSPAVASFQNIVGVTAPLPPPIGRELQWRVLAHMAMNYRSIAELEVLKATVDVYNFQAIVDRQAARANQLRVQALKAIEVRPTDRLYRGAPVRGISASVEIDEGGFASEGDMYLFSGVLNELLASYVSLNSFAQLTVTGTNTRVVHKWEPKNGSLYLI